MTTTIHPATTISEAAQRARETYPTDAAHEITEEAYYECLNVMPPIYGFSNATQSRRFWVGEAYTHNSRGVAVCLECWQQPGAERFFYRLSECDRYQ